MFLRCQDRELRMVSHEHWGESLPESVREIEENKRSSAKDQSKNNCDEDMILAGVIDIATTVLHGLSE